MIKVYTSGDSNPSRNALKWFKTNGITVEERKINDAHPITKKEIKDMLILSYNGFDDILNARLEKAQDLLIELNCRSVEQAIDLIIQYPELLKKPIIMDEKNLVVGFNLDCIRRFRTHKN